MDNHRLPHPQPLHGAALAWSAPYDRTTTAAAAWTQQRNIPRPDAEIATVDLAYGPDKRALLAATSPP